MTIVNEIPRVHTWIKTVLSADATLNNDVGGRIYRGRVPQNGAYPAVVYALLSPGDDVPATGGGRIWARPLYLVKVVTEGNKLLSIQTIADRIDAVLQGVVGGSSSGIAIDYCVRKRPFYMDEVDAANKVYQHLGGEYELGVRAA